MLHEVVISTLETNGRIDILNKEKKIIKTKQKFSK